MRKPIEAIFFKLFSQYKNCGRELNADEIGLHKKLCGKQSTVFCCISCLAEYFQVSEELLKEKTEQFKAMGCSLFK